MFLFFLFYQYCKLPGPKHFKKTKFINHNQNVLGFFQEVPAILPNRCLLHVESSKYPQPIIQPLTIDYIKYGSLLFYQYWKHLKQTIPKKEYSMTTINMFQLSTRSPSATLPTLDQGLACLPDKNQIPPLIKPLTISWIKYVSLFSFLSILQTSWTKAF